jgi:isocitrate/isopropylmalate dehydrogenase
MLLRHCGAPDAATAVEDAVVDSLLSGVGTEDVGGSLGTQATGDWIAQRIARVAH